MALADELLDSISEDQSAEYMSVGTNPHIVIDEDRNIILPERYKIIAAQGDHNMATYTFDCPRFSDGRDMSQMVVYINYIRSDGETGSYPADNVSIDAQDNDLMHFEWTPLLPATLEHGTFAFLVCVCRTEPDGNMENHWSTRLCKDATISEGMDCHQNTIIDMYPDVITRILERLNVLEKGGTTSVQYTVQDLKEEQKLQARKNIEAADVKEIESLKYVLVSDGMGSTVVKGSDYEEGTKIKFAVPAGGGTRRVEKETKNIDTGEIIIELYDLNYPASDAGKEIIVSTDAYTTTTFESGFTVYVSRPTTNYLKEEIIKLSEDIANLKENGTGAGGGGGNNAVLSVANTCGWVSNTITDSEDCIVSFTWSSVEDGLFTGKGSLTVKVNGISKMVKNIEQGDISLNIKEFLGAGTNTVRLTVSDVYGNSRTLSLSVTIVSFSLASTFDDSRVYYNDITFSYTPTGGATKTMQFILDGSLIGSVQVTVSGRQQNFVIPVQSHGPHSFEVYFTADVNGNTVESNRLYYDIIFVDLNDVTPIIASSFAINKMSQYYTVSIPYVVYTPGALTSDVTLFENGKELSSLSVDRTKHVWTYRADNVGETLLEIVTGDVRKAFNITVSETDIDVTAEENNLDLYLASYGRSNNEENPGIWNYGPVSAEFTGFNFVSDGWQTDNDKNTVLRVQGDARVNIPLNVFSSDFRETGKTIEFEFATKDIMNYETEIMSCFADGKGFVFTPQKATLSSEQSSVFTQYKEDEHVRVSFVVDKKVENRLINVYIDGVLSGTIQYPESDDFQQTNPVGITIGSNDCTVDLYCIRIYSNNLTRYQILDNWIADTQNGYDMLQRYNHNNIYDDYGQIVISKLPADLPYLVIEGPVLPQYKGDKKTVSGYYADPINPEKSFRFEDATIDVQGTSSQYYKRKNYKIKFSNGFIMEVSGKTLEVYQMREDSIGVDTFTFKADVASSEGANNVELVKLWDDICTYKTPPQQENPDVRQGIDGFPIVVFWSNGTETTFLGKYNFNNDKGTEDVFGFAEGDESWEIKNNTSARSMFKSDDFTGDAWLEDFEGRYPDGNKNPAKLKELATWLVSTDQTQATGDLLSESVTYEYVEYTHDTAEYRLAKFKAEAPDWFEMNSLIFSYVFTELFLLVDSRAKNNFPTRYVGGKWCFLPYDMDTAIGTNNEGLLVYDYTLEDVDTVNGANVYNGQDSVIYINTRAAFSDKIEEMYKKLRSDGVLSYDIVEQRFEDHQSLWPEAIFNEDAYYKYIDPLLVDGEATYLSMCQGSKESQRKWWLFNRFRYIDSKYTCGDALTNTITLRAYQKSDFEITPYADIYPCVAFDSTRVKERGKRNEVCNIISPAAWDPNGSDAVVTVYSADQLKDVGDISPFKVGYADFSKATKLQRIKVGDASESYSNGNMTELYVGNNALLKTVDARNCHNLAGEVNLSGCTNIEEAYFDGTSVSSVALPNGGVLKILHLPETVANFTIKNQIYVSDLTVAGYENITTISVENCPAIDTLDLLERAVNVKRVRMTNVDWTFDDAGFLLELVKKGVGGLDESGLNTANPFISGKCHIASLSISDVKAMNTHYPYLELTYDDVFSITRSIITRTLASYKDDVITVIKSEAFYNFRELTTVSLGNLITLNTLVFNNCTSLESVILSAETMVTLGNTNAFNATPIASGTGYIYVPRALVDSYKTATNWSAYANQFRAIEDYPEICGGE